MHPKLIEYKFYFFLAFKLEALLPTFIRYLYVSKKKHITRATFTSYFSPTSGPSWSSSRDVHVSVCLFVCLSVCPLPMRFFCVVGLVQRVPRPWTGAISISISISISSRALKTRRCSGV